jgi:hypothetical protein
MRPAQVGLLFVEDVDLPAHGRRVAGVHLEQVAGEQRRLLAALAGLDLEDRVRGVVGVTRGQQLGQPLGDLGEAGLDAVGLDGEGRVLDGELAGRVQVVGEPVVLLQRLHDAG